MGNFNLDDYEEVKDRLPKFWDEHKGPVITELMSDVNNVTFAVFKAELYDGEQLLATGWAYEKAGDGYVNKTSHLENCETSAIGRALANMGLHGAKRPSKEEMKKVERMSEEITPEQVAILNGIISVKKLDLKDIYVRYHKRYGITIKKLEEITKVNYDEIHKALKGK